MTQSPISCTIDLDAPGRNLGYLQLPHSVHRSAYGHIPVPIASVVGAGDGPSVLLMAGNHGDEYEGQVILSDLIRTLKAEDVRGRIAILPMANFPAAQAGLRVSPIDDVNMNRSFPGAPRGTPTMMLSHYIETVLIAGRDAVLDLHSGGSSFFCIPFGMTAWEDGNPRNPMRRAVLDAMGLHAILHHAPDGDSWFSSSAAWRAGAAGFTMELGGAGTVDPAIRRGAQAGLMRALAAIGAYTGPVSEEAISASPRRLTGEDLIFADEPGLYEPLAASGEDVTAGQPAALIHFPETPGKAPMEVRFPRDAYILAHRIPARVVRGDSLFHVAFD